MPSFFSQELFAMCCNWQELLEQVQQQRALAE
jgi:hypothetical protein